MAWTNLECVGRCKRPEDATFLALQHAVRSNCLVGWRILPCPIIQEYQGGRVCSSQDGDPRGGACPSRCLAQPEPLGVESGIQSRLHSDALVRAIARARMAERAGRPRRGGP